MAGPGRIPIREMGNLRRNIPNKPSKGVKIHKEGKLNREPVCRATCVDSHRKLLQPTRFMDPHHKSPRTRIPPHNNLGPPPIKIMRGGGKKEDDRRKNEGLRRSKRLRKLGTEEETTERKMEKSRREYEQRKRIEISMSELNAWSKANSRIPRPGARDGQCCPRVTKQILAWHCGRDVMVPEVRREAVRRGERLTEETWRRIPEEVRWLSDWNKWEHRDKWLTRAAGPDGGEKPNGAHWSDILMVYLCTVDSGCRGVRLLSEKGEDGKIKPVWVNFASKGWEADIAWVEGTHWICLTKPGAGCEKTMRKWEPVWGGTKYHLRGGDTLLHLESHLNEGEMKRIEGDETRRRFVGDGRVKYSSVGRGWNPLDYRFTGYNGRTETATGSEVQTLERASQLAGVGMTHLLVNKYSQDRRRGDGT